MSKAMSLNEFAALANLIRAEHSPYKAVAPGKRRVKYIYPSLDFRTEEVFAVRLSEFPGPIVAFHTQNDCRDLPKSLYERIVNWLNKTESEEDARYRQIEPC